jgi:putative membrane protein
MQETRTFSDKIFLVIKGILMGAANKVPGVSGGMVAFVAGFYEEFIFSLRRFNLNSLKLIVNGRFRSLWYYTNGRFLSLLILGMVISYFSVSLLLDYLITHFELYVWAAFFGMILGSIYYISKDFEEWNRANIGFVLLGIIAGASISFLEPASQNDNLWFVFFCGIIGVSGMTLPGLSGSFILILLGNYVLLLVDSVNALYMTISEIVVLDFSFTEDRERVRLLKVLLTFTAGSIAGLVSLSHILGYLIKHFKSATFAVIIGFITGSLGVVWPWKEAVYRRNAEGEFLYAQTGDRIIDNYNRYLPDLLNYQTWIAIGFIIVGAALVLWVAYVELKNKKNDA